MSNKTSALSATILIVITLFACPLMAFAVIPEDLDLTDLQDANYVEGQLLVRFAPKSDGIQRSITEKD